MGMDAAAVARWEQRFEQLADEVYGNDSRFRGFVESRGQPYVLAVSSPQRLWVEFRQKRVHEIARTTPAQARQRLSVGDGAKGAPLYDWAAARFGIPTEGGLIHWLLIRRSVTDPDDLAYYLCLAPQGTSGKDLARAAGQSKPALNPPNRRPAWTSTKCAAGRAGTGT